MKFAISHIIVLSLVLFGFGSFLAADSSAGWTTWRGPNNDGTIRTTKFNPSFPSTYTQPVWRTVIGAGYSSLAVTDLFVYTMGAGRQNDKDMEIVYCLDRKTGNEVWSVSRPLKRTFEYEGPRAMPVLDGENLYVFGLAGDLYCLNAKNGRQKWHRNVMDEGALPARWGFSSSPVIEGKFVIVNACEAGMAFDKNSGKLIWKTAKKANGYATPVLFTRDGKRLMAVFGTKTVSIVNVADGKILMTYLWETGYDVNASDPVVFPNGQLFVSSAYYKGSGLLDFSSGKLVSVREQKDMGTHFSQMITRDGYMYGVDGSTQTARLTKVACMEIATGKIMWQNKINAYGSIMIVNDTIVLLTENGQLTTIRAEPSAYSEIATTRVFEGWGVAWVSPVFWDGYLYLRSNIGEILCLKAE